MLQHTIKGWSYKLINECVYSHHLLLHMLNRSISQLMNSLVMNTLAKLIEVNHNVH